MSAPIKVTDQVQWMQTTVGSGGSMRFSTHYGTVLRITGHVAMVNCGHGRQKSIELSKLSPRSQPSPVNKVFNAIAGKSP